MTRVPSIIFAAALVSIVVTSGSAWAEPPAALTWPRTPGVDLGAAERAAAAEGVRVIGFAPMRAQLEAIIDRREAADEALFERVGDDLDRARRAFLEQRFGHVVEILAETEDAALTLLARPEHVELLWEVELQLGIAYLFRRGDGDGERARERFELCLALDRARSPSRELYGPDVAQAFARARAARESRAPRPMRVRMTPADARVVIDGRPVLDLRKGRALRDGLHVVRAGAPGYETRAEILRVGRGVAIELALRLAPSDDPLERIAEAWSDGELSAESSSGRQALVAIARAAGADHIWELGGSDDARVRSIDVADAGPPTYHPDVAAAARAARGEPLDFAASPQSDRSPLYRRWWVWAGGTAVSAAATTAITLSATRQPSRLRILARDP